MAVNAIDCLVWPRLIELGERYLRAAVNLTHQLSYAVLAEFGLAGLTDYSFRSTLIELNSYRSSIIQVGRSAQTNFNISKPASRPARLLEPNRTVHEQQLASKSSCNLRVSC